MTDQLELQISLWSICLDHDRNSMVQGDPTLMGEHATSKQKVGWESNLTPLYYECPTFYLRRWKTLQRSVLFPQWSGLITLAVAKLWVTWALVGLFYAAIPCGVITTRRMLTGCWVPYKFRKVWECLLLEVGKIDEGHCSTGIAAIRSWNFAAVMAQLSGCGVTAKQKGKSVF